MLIVAGEATIASGESLKKSRIFLLALIAIPGASQAISFSFSDGGDHRASAEFTLVGNQIKVVLTNTYALATTQPNQILTALFWDVASNPSWTKASADLTAGSSWVNDPGNDHESAGKHWAYKHGPMDLDATAGTLIRNYGLSATGCGLFGNSDTFESGGSNPVLNGADYGLTGNAGTTLPGGGHPDPLIFNSMTFFLNGAAANFDLETIGNVRFLWGTSVNEFQGGGGSGNHFFTPTPEPATMGFAALAVSAAIARRRRAAQKSA